MSKYMFLQFSFLFLISCTSDVPKEIKAKVDIDFQEIDMKDLSLSDAILPLHQEIDQIHSDQGIDQTHLDQAVDQMHFSDQAVDQMHFSDQAVDQMLTLEDVPNGLSFSQAHTLVEGTEDLYYFAITETKTVLIETSSDGQGTCPSSLDTTLKLYRYQQGMRTEPMIAQNDDQDTLAGKFCSRIATTLEAGIYEVAVGSYHDQAIAQYVLTLSFTNPAQIGEICNAENVCIDASFCDVISQTCISNAPKIESARAYYDVDRIYLSADVQDLDLDSGILDHLIFLDINGMEVGRLGSKLLDLYQTINFSFVEIATVHLLDLSTVHQIEFVIRDFSHHLSEAYRVELLPLPVLSDQATCAVDKHLGKCDQMSYCQPNLGQTEGICTTNHPPVINVQGALAYIHDIAIIIKIMGSDIDQNINRIAVSYFDINQQPVLINQQAEQIKNIYHQRDQSYYLATVLLDVYPQITTAKVSLIDTGDLRSEAIEINLQVQPQVAVDQPCDAYLLENNCGNLICDVQKDVNGKPIFENGVCKDIAPQVFSAIASRDMDHLYLKLIGIDQDQNLSQIGLNALDAQGQIIPFQNSIEPLFFDINLIQYDVSGNFTASIAVSQLFLDIPNVSTLLVYALDSTDYQSIGLEIPIINRSVVALTFACDVHRVENICDLGLACENQICTVPIAPEILGFSFFHQTSSTIPTTFFKIKAQLGSSNLALKAYFIPKDSQGNLVPLINGQSRFLLRNPVLFEIFADQTLELYFSFEHPLAHQISEVEIWIKDINDISSTHITSSLLANKPILMQNELCDLQQKFGICQQGLVCVDHDMDIQTADRCMP